MTDPQQQPMQINIELDEKTAEGTYSNFVIINHSPAEFIIDFTTILPGIQKAKVHSRVVMTPQHTKSLLVALQDNITKFEANFGAIKSASMPNQQMGFRVDDKKQSMS
jgi:hypothetical protein